MCLLLTLQHHPADFVRFVFSSSRCGGFSFFLNNQCYARTEGRRRESGKEGNGRERERGRVRESERKIKGKGEEKEKRRIRRGREGEGGRLKKGERERGSGRK